MNSHYNKNLKKLSRKLKLVIEIDGKSEEDYHRQNKLETLGFQFLRFTKAEII